MIEIKCFVGSLNGANFPQALFDTYAQGRIGDLFQSASLNDFSLAMQPPTFINFAPAGSAVTALDLHVALARLLPGAAGGPVNRIGLLLAPRYGYFPKALGVMFDRGFATDDDPNRSTEYTAIPREGCAVFLDTIRDLRKTDELSEKEAHFCAVHELGHVFNLSAHTVNELTFMTQSSDTQVYDPLNVFFNTYQKDWLSHCSTWKAVHPGGSPFGASGPNGALDAFTHFDRPRASKHGRRAPSGLNFSIAMNKEEFWQFEPLDLNVRLSVPRGVARSFRVPEMIDPGYGQFRVFIENPLGERRLFKGLLRHCPHAHTVTVSASQPYERDISLTRDALGYTFQLFGIHSIYAEFEMSASRVLRSNIVKVNVLPETARNARARVARKFLASPRARVLLEHRQDFSDRKGIQLLTEYLEDAKPAARIATDVRYALGRACLVHATDSFASFPTPLRQKGRDYLSRALDSGHLTRHQAKRAHEYASAEDEI